MATTVTKVIDPDSGSGYDYDSLYDWEAGQQGDLTGVRDEIAVAKCRCTGGTADTTAVIINGWTTSATQYIKIWTDPAENYRHNGLGAWPSGNIYRIQASGTYIQTIVVEEQYCQLIGLAIKSPAGTGTNYYGAVLLGESGDATNTTIKDSVIIGNTSGATNSNGDVVRASFPNQKLINCILRDSAACGFRQSNYDAPEWYSYLYNCLISGCATGVLSTGGASTVVCKNCYSFSNSADDYGISSSGVVDKTTCASEDETGSTGLTGIAPSTSTGAYFTSVTAGSEDFHIGSLSALVGAGTNLYNDATYPFQTDIDGQDRGGAAAAWDIGADEYVATATTVSAGKSDLVFSVKSCTVDTGVIDTTVSAGKSDLTLSINASAVSFDRLFAAGKQDLTFSISPATVLFDKTISAGKSDLVFTVQAATVSTRANVVFAAEKQDLTLSISAASILFDCLVSIGKQDLTLSVQASTVVTSDIVTVSVGKQDLVLSVSAASVLFDSTILAGKQDLVLSVQVATVSTSSNITVAANKQDLTFTIQAASVLFDTAVAVGKQDLTLTVLGATVSTSDSIVVAAGKQDLVFSINPATVLFDKSVAAGKQNIVFSINPASIAYGATVEVGKQDLTLSINSATISTESQTVVSAGKQDLVFLINPASVSHDCMIVTQTQTLFFTVKASTVSTAMVEGALSAVVVWLGPSAACAAYQPSGSVATY